jgi:4-hydroxy-3-polyprenylbenzoate decarboxylase
MLGEPLTKQEIFMKKRLIVAISGASGVTYGVRLLEVLNKMEQIEVHLIISNSAEMIIKNECKIKNIEKIKSLADVVHDFKNIGAKISSGSFITHGMVVIPCSIKTLSGIANSYNENLIIRAADVCLKERRKLVIVVRETPFHLGHLKLMEKVTRIGGVILPPMPSFYHEPDTIDDIINQTIGKVLDQFQIEHNLFKRWGGE